MARPEKKLMRKRIINAYLSSVISISLVLLLTGVAALLAVNARGVSRYLKENMHVSVLLKDEATEAQAQAWAAFARAMVARGLAPRVKSPFFLVAETRLII